MAVDCYTRHGLEDDKEGNPHPLKDIIEKGAAKYSDLSQKEARIQSIKDIQTANLDQLQSVYRQVGIPGHEPREEAGPEDPSKPVELTPVDTSKGNITTVGPNEKSTPIDLKVEPDKKKAPDETPVSKAESSDKPGDIPAAEKKPAEKAADKTVEAKVGDEFSFAGNTWKVTEDLGDKVKATNADETVQTTFPKDAVSKNIIPPGGEPPESTPAAGKGPEKEWTAIRKEKQVEFENVKKAYADQTVQTWQESLDNGIKSIQEKYPTDNIYDGSKKEMESLLAAIGAKQKPSIDVETLAVLHNFRTETSARISNLEAGRNSDDYIKRQAAMAASNALYDDGAKAAFVIKEGTTAAGRALNYAQAEMAFDPEYGLQIRRMQLQESNGGERLSEAQLDYTAEQWKKEKALLKREQELREQGMQESFDKQIADLHKSYQEKLKANKTAHTSVTKAPVSAVKKIIEKAGKDGADWLRKGKLGKDQTFATFPGVKEAINLTIETIAQIVEKGATVAQAIADFIKDNVEKGREKEFKDAFLNHVYSANRNTDVLEDIRLNAEATGARGITKDMVAKNQIRDYMDSHIGQMEPAEIIDVAAAGLKKILPDATKEQLIEAYNKQGQYYIEPEKKIKSDFENDKRVLVKLAKIEQDLNDLRDKNNIYKKSGNASKVEQTDKAIAAKEQELAKALRDRGEKITGEDKYTKASYATRAASHNDRLQEIITGNENAIKSGELSPQQVKELEKLNERLKDSSVLLDPKSSLSQRNVLDLGLTKLKDIASDFDKVKGSDEFSDTKRLLQRAIDKFGSDKDQTEQSMKLERVKDRLKSENLERERKINAGEFEDKPVVILKQSDADLIRLRIERDKLESGFKYERQKLENQNRSWQRRVFDFSRAALVTSYIWKPATYAKIIATSILRPNVEAFTKATFGNAFQFISKPIWDVAKGGGESSSWRAVKKQYEAFFMQKGPEALAKMYERANQKYNETDARYNELAAKVSNMEKTSPDYKGDQKKLAELKKERDSNLIDAVGNVLYQYIGGSSLKDALDSLVNRSNIIEREFGFLEKEKLKNGDFFDKVKYILEFVGRSHSAIKTFSGRANFAAGFIARVEYAVKNGVDVSSPDKMLEIASESYLDWEKGKYQQKNFVSDIWAGLGNFVERQFKGQEWEKYGKGLSMLMKLDVAITRVPVNILHEAVMEYTLGSFRAFWMMGKEYASARKEVKAEGIFPGEKEFSQALRDQVSKMDKKQAATIVRCFRKGGFGLGLYALMSIGGVLAYGGFHNKHQKKNYDEDELKPGEISLFGYKLPKAFSGIVEHQPSFFPALLGANTAKVYNDKIAADETDFSSAMSAVMSSLEYMQDQIPQTKALQPITVLSEAAKGMLRGFGISTKKH